MSVTIAGDVDFLVVLTYIALDGTITLGKNRRNVYGIGTIRNMTVSLHSCSSLNFAPFFQPF